ncbi:MAG: glutamine-synthetase adenylyltransferase [Boseongicola sp.]|nr:glutamine-synthetase adenylyltransferase [Boseongicola sp.]
MSLSGNIRRLPVAHDQDRSRDNLSALGLKTGALADLIAGAAGSSVYLSDLLHREGDWLLEVADKEPDTVRRALLEETQSVSEDVLAAQLRKLKRRVALYAGLADLGGVWALEDVTGLLTDFACAATDRALKAAVGKEILRKKLPGQSAEDIDVAGGLSVLAMGKMGAGELNYSSDIDLICLYDETRFEPDDYGEARASFVRAVRKMTAILSERTADGYVFRTDLRLRPDASVTPVAISMEAAERYYEAFGRTWERAAYIKASAVAGDVEAGKRFLETLRPFVWRRHLDFAAIQDAHDMRLRIRDHKGLHKAASHLGHDLKLGQGGIREIEFFTQTRQLIAGGRDPELRVRGTVDGLSVLAAKGWVNSDEADQLASDYRALREAEHRVQMVADQQTHVLPITEDEFARLACLAGQDPSEYAQALEEMFVRVHRLTEGFFAPSSPATSKTNRTEVAELSREVIDRWKGYPALRSERAVEIFKRMEPVLLDRLAAAARPSEALVNFDGFLSGLPSGVQLFSLFEANPQLLDLVVDIVDTAPGLGQHLARNAPVFDAVIGGGFFSEWPGAEGLTISLTDELVRLQDYEARLDRARVWAREWHFRVGVHHLRGIIDAHAAGQQYADLATAVVRALWPFVIETFAAKHGSPPGRGAVVIAMGSLGAERLNAASDLDLIVVYDANGAESSDGRRPLATRAYYARLTQALVTAISAPTAEGRLYEVDMRLRPSGRQGPVATGFGAFQTYQETEAWTWEHLALTRARVIAGNADLGAQISDFRRALLAKPLDRAATLADVADMRARLATAKPGGAALDIKTGPGRLQDIELFAQTGALLRRDAARSLSDQLGAAIDVFDLSPEDGRVLRAAVDLFWTVQSAARLISKDALTSEATGASAEAFLLRDLDVESVADLSKKIAKTAEYVADLIDKSIGADASVG